MPYICPNCKAEYPTMDELREHFNQICDRSKIFNTPQPPNLHRPWTGPVNYIRVDFVSETFEHSLTEPTEQQLVDDTESSAVAWIRISHSSADEYLLGGWKPINSFGDEG